jgi:trans-aconitate methyltransferase
MSQFDIYGKIATTDIEDIVQNGRYYFQQEAEKFMPVDIFSKLTVNSEDSFIDIGCGTGVNLREALKYTKNCSACDHANVIKKIEQYSEFSDVNFYPGDLLSLDIKKQFSKILIYGVIQTLPDEVTMYSFIEKALSLMQEDGLMLIGDLSNIDKKRRFLNSKRGAAFQKEWEEKFAKADKIKPIKNLFSSESDKAISITDNIVFDILKIYREKGFHTYLLNQHPKLSFGNTREDILIAGPEYNYQ